VLENYLVQPSSFCFGFFKSSGVGSKRQGLRVSAADQRGPTEDDLKKCRTHPRAQHQRKGLCLLRSFKAGLAARRHPTCAPQAQTP